MVVVTGSPIVLIPIALIPIALIFSLVGLIISIKPEWLIKIQVWQTKTFLGAEYIPSKRTLLTMRIFGIFFLVLGLFLGLYWFLFASV